MLNEVINRIDHDVIVLDKDYCISHINKSAFNILKINKHKCLI